MSFLYGYGKGKCSVCKEVKQTEHRVYPIGEIFVCVDCKYRLTSEEWRLINATRLEIEK